MKKKSPVKNSLKRKARILLYDLETEPNLSYTWGKWEQNVIAFKEEWKLLSFAYKWLDEKTVHCKTTQYQSEKQLLKQLHALLSEADIVITQNGDAFDNKKANAKFIEFGFPPLKPYQSIDTKKVAKRHFKFNSNSLDDMGTLLGVGRKMKHSGFSLWLGCMNGVKSAWTEMIKYNKQDVLLLEKIYLKMRPWMNNHPNIALIEDRPDSCPNCGGESFRSCGFKYNKTSYYRSFRCNDCSAYCRSRKSENKPLKKVN